MASQIAALEADKKAYQEQLDLVQTQLKDDADNAELVALQTELSEMIGLLNESLSELQPKQAPKRPSPPPAPEKQVPRQEEKWSRESHPAFKKTQQTLPAAAAGEEKEEAPISYQVNDEVLAKWLSGDKKFWPARITSITGSSTAPIYIVKFKNYKGAETLRAKDIRPAFNKRKAEWPPATTTTAATSSTTQPPSGSHHPTSSGGSAAVPPAVTGPASATSTSGVVMSAAASLYPETGNEAEKNGRDVQGKPPRAKKIKANKELEAGKNKWQEFNSKSKFGKSHKKESMFRTPEGIHGRVGFTGSGQAMRKDPTRSRHVYQTNEDAD